ncbi:MAG: tRNA 4-thiouridine(8) synthase ThiI [Candidatus Altiarchaeota archaeon]|nr:tRNA 4-thiouridine(8) synthase ThiI [Candidatus Altiarchaeota archaeon]
MEQSCVLVRYGEIALKGGNKGMFERRLKDNIKKMLERDGIGECTIERISGRFVLNAKNPNAASSAARVFGVTSASPALKIRPALEDIKAAALEIIRDVKPSSFRVTAGRLDKTFRMTSVEVNNTVGGYLKDETGCTVRLRGAELDIGIDLAKDGAYIHTHRIEGVGGLPVGVSGKVLCLFSGGIDSPVAAYLALKRGCDVTLLHFIHDEKNPKPGKIQELQEKLAAYHPSIKLLYIPTGKIEKDLVMNAQSKYRIILLRRIFMRIASRLCHKTGAKAIVTGDNIGQVASQTLDNLNVIDEAAGVLTIRPLAGFDKREIIDIANKIGTYETSIQQYTDCCNFLLPQHPETKADLATVKKIEEQLDETLIEAALDKGYEG